MVEFDGFYVRNMGYSRLRNVKTNISNYNVFDEKSTFYITGNVLPNETYVLEYDIDYYNSLSNLVFYNPDKTNINNIIFRIKNEQEFYNINPNQFYNTHYKIYEDGNTVIGELKEPFIDENNNRSIFIVDIKKNSQREKAVAEDKGISPLFGINWEKNIVFLMLEIAIIGIILLLTNGDKIGKALYIIYLAIIVALIIWQYCLISPWTLVALIFYGFFYYFLFKATDKIGTICIVLFFLIFHSYFVIGIYVGLIQHIINNINIFISVLLYRKYVSNKDKV